MQSLLALYNNFYYFWKIPDKLGLCALIIKSKWKVYTDECATVLLKTTWTHHHCKKPDMKSWHPKFLLIYDVYLIRLTPYLIGNREVFSKDIPFMRIIYKYMSYVSNNVNQLLAPLSDLEH